jgi:hypothetical protein
MDMYSQWNQQYAGMDPAAAQMYWQQYYGGYGPPQPFYGYGAPPAGMPPGLPPMTTGAVPPSTAGVGGPIPPVEPPKEEQPPLPAEPPPEEEVCVRHVIYPIIFVFHMSAAHLLTSFCEIHLAFQAVLYVISAFANSLQEIY